MVHIPFLIFSFTYLRPSLLLQKLQLHIPESKTLLFCQSNIFWPNIAIINKIGAIVTTVITIKWLHDVNLEHSLMKEKKINVPTFGIPDLALGILKMLIDVCSHDVLQSAIY